MIWSDMSESGGLNALNTFKAQLIMIPLWWYFIHSPFIVVLIVNWLWLGTSPVAAVSGLTVQGSEHDLSILTIQICLQLSFWLASLSLFLKLHVEPFLL